MRTNEKGLKPVRYPRGQVAQKHLPENATDSPRTGHARDRETATRQPKPLSVTFADRPRTGRLGVPVRFPAPPRGAGNGHPGQHPHNREQKMSQKLEETPCKKCGKPTTTTRTLITQTWDLTPIPRTTAMWAALLRGPVLAITQTGTTWRAQWDRNQIDPPSRHDTATTWLSRHECGAPPFPDARPPITLTPPAPGRMDRPYRQADTGRDDDRPHVQEPAMRQPGAPAHAVQLRERKAGSRDGLDGRDVQQRALQQSPCPRSVASHQAW